MKRKDRILSFFRAGRFGIFSIAWAVFVSCGGFSENSSEKESVTVMNWNLQTFFDAEFDGNEYSEYKSAKSGWSVTKYNERLERLAAVIKELDADVVVMEELEKEAQLNDIANMLSGTFNFSKLYKYAVFSTNPGSSIGCAVLSRLPIDEISVHSLDLRSYSSSQPSMRPVMQVSVHSGAKKFVLFVNHWKSKSGGEEESRIWRRSQERLLARLMAKEIEKGNSVLATGDFNQDISEFEEIYGMPLGKNIVLRGKSSVPARSPWILENGTYSVPGSYWYQGAWERIDHFFAGGGLELSDFSAENEGVWADSDGHPARYQLWNGWGYSDHLPITCTVCF